MMVHKHYPKKYLGQHFLKDPHARERIVQTADIQANDEVIEIGPGQGAITAMLAKQAKHLLAVEYDRELIDALKIHLHGLPAEVCQADFLAWAWPQGYFKVVGNIPYNISTPIIERLIQHRLQVSRAILLVQEEFGRRLAAKPGSKDYGSLSVYAQFYARIEYQFLIKAGCFYPPPKVNSCVISLDFTQQPYHTADEAFLFKMVQTVFTQRRKTLLNALTLLVDKQQAQEALRISGIDPALRCECLSITDFIRLSEALK